MVRFQPWVLNKKIMASIENRTLVRWNLDFNLKEDSETEALTQLEITLTQPTDQAFDIVHNLYSVDVEQLRDFAIDLTHECNTILRKNKKKK